ncbi:MAG: hypothetical protein M1371_04735 [Actinobacteria bacterium]|nr:hypothetical protein [Actinomycetota bacterium]
MKKRTASWRIDLKWIFGIIFTLFLMPTLAVLALFQVATPQNAQNLVSNIIESQLGNMFDSQYENLLMVARVAGENEIVLPEININLGITGNQALSMSEEEFKRIIFSKFAEVLLSEQQLPGGLELGPLSAVFGAISKIFGPQMRIQLRLPIIIISLADLIFFIPFVLFSFRFGKIFNPGVSLLIASLPGLVITGAGQLLGKLSGSSQGDLMSALIKTLGVIMQPVFRMFVIFGIVGLALCFIGILAGIIIRAVSRGKTPVQVTDTSKA